MPKTKLTKQERYWISQYENSEDFSVETAYRNPSKTKCDIEFDIKYRMIHDYNGFDYRILSHNGFHFSCGFRTKDENGNHFLIVFTPSRWFNVVPLETVDSETGEYKNWINDYDEICVNI